MKRVVFRVGKTEDDRMIIAWLESKPPGERAPAIKKAILSYIRNPDAGGEVEKLRYELAAYKEVLRELLSGFKRGLEVPTQMKEEGKGPPEEVKRKMQKLVKFDL